MHNGSITTHTNPEKKTAYRKNRNNKRMNTCKEKTGKVKYFVILIS
jgi:hypothetical protein